MQPQVDDKPPRRSRRTSPQPPHTQAGRARAPEPYLSPAGRAGGGQEARLRAEPWTQSLQRVFQSVQPLFCSRDRPLLTNFTTSPRRDWS
ncbi:hypothetical protein QE370_002331 [Aeromicrobium sp. SORGH_AS981]|nr:hypothetical protein [Aeromicrobium sp. SORGH_AS_0981]